MKLSADQVKALGLDKSPNKQQPKRLQSTVKHQQTQRTQTSPAKTYVVQAANSHSLSNHQHQGSTSLQNNGDLVLVPTTSADGSVSFVLKQKSPIRLVNSLPNNRVTYGRIITAGNNTSNSSLILPQYQQQLKRQQKQRQQQQQQFSTLLKPVMSPTVVKTVATGSHATVGGGVRKQPLLLPKPLPVMHQTARIQQHQHQQPATFITNVKKENMTILGNSATGEILNATSNQPKKTYVKVIRKVIPSSSTDASHLSGGLQHQQPRQTIIEASDSSQIEALLKAGVATVGLKKGSSQVLSSVPSTSNGNVIQQKHQRIFDLKSAGITKEMLRNNRTIGKKPRQKFQKLL